MAPDLPERSDTPINVDEHVDPTPVPFAVDPETPEPPLGRAQRRVERRRLRAVRRARRAQQMAAAKQHKGAKKGKGDKKGKGR